MIEYIAYFLIFCYVVNKLTSVRSDSKLWLNGKTAIITGANRGLGYATALDFASRGCRIIIAGRTKMEEAREKIIKETGNPNVVVKYLYLESLDSVRKFADDINKTEEKIDILVNNAGIGASDQPYTADNLPFVMQVNYLAPFLLTHLLVGRLKKSEDPRIVFVTSLCYITNTLNLDTFTQPKTLDYPNSKLSQVIATKIFAEKLKPFGISVNAAHPGGVKTAIYNKAYTKNIVLNILAGILHAGTLYLGKNVDEGAQTTIHLATSNSVKNVSGKLFVENLQFPVLSLKANNRNFCERLWKMSEELVRLKPNEKLL